VTSPLPPAVPPEADPAAVADLFEELAYAGEITPDGHYVDHSSWPTFVRVLGGSVPAGVEPGVFWESRIHPEDIGSSGASTGGCWRARTPRSRTG
jgi:hypothetical protein